MQGYNADMDATLFGQEEDMATVRSKVNGAQRWQGVKEMDAPEEEYFNTSDDEDELAARPRSLPTITNGSSAFKPLVDYPDDEEDAIDMKARPPSLKSSPIAKYSPDSSSTVTLTESLSPCTLPSTPTHTPQVPPERLSEKRRREEDEEDELSKLSFTTKRRSSSVSSASLAHNITSTAANSHIPTNFLRRKKSFSSLNNSKDSSTTTSKGKISISLAVKNPPNAVETESGGGDSG